MYEYVLTRDIRPETLRRFYEHLSRWLLTRHDWRDSSLSVAINGRRLTLTADTDGQLDAMLEGLWLQLRVHCLPRALFSMGLRKAGRAEVVQSLLLNEGLTQHEAALLNAHLKPLSLPVEARLYRRRLHLRSDSRPALQRALVQLRKPAQESGLRVQMLQ